MTPQQSNLLQSHRTIADELAIAHRTLAMLRAERFRNWAASWRATEGWPVTERNHKCSADCADWDAQVSMAQGERDALQVELAHVELELAHADTEP